MKLGAGDDLYRLFAGILTMRPWDRVIDPAVDHLEIRGNDSDRSELQVIIHQRKCLFKSYVRRRVVWEMGTSSPHGSRQNH